MNAINSLALGNWTTSLQFLFHLNYYHVCCIELLSFFQRPVEYTTMIIMNCFEFVNVLEFFNIIIQFTITHLRRNYILPHASTTMIN